MCIPKDAHLIEEQNSPDSFRFCYLLKQTAKLALSSAFFFHLAFLFSCNISSVVFFMSCNIFFLLGVFFYLQDIHWWFGALDQILQGHREKPASDIF